MTLAEIHARLAYTTLYFVIIVGVWGLWRVFRRQGLDGSFWGTLVIGELLILAQTLLGGYLYLTGERPMRSIHLLYGFVSLLVVPGVFVYTRGGDKRREILIYALSLIFTAALVFRAITTGG